MFHTTIVFSNDRIPEIDNNDLYQTTYSNPKLFNKGDVTSKYTHYWATQPNIIAVCEALGMTNLYSPVVPKTKATQAEPKQAAPEAKVTKTTTRKPATKKV